MKSPVTIEGVGLQTGAKVKVRINGSPANSGINFIRVDLPNKPLLDLRSLDLGSSESKDRRTTIGSGPLQVQTTEHLLAALSGLGIDNAAIEMDNAELPGLDGSAKEYVDAIKKAGMVEQPAERKEFFVKEPVWVEGDGSMLAVFPSEDFKISYTLSYANPALGTMLFNSKIDEEVFSREIAPARTFCMQKEALMLLICGIGRGATFENALVIGRKGPIKNKFRFPDEPVRHKTLDLMGDLYLLGMPIRGHVVAVKSGHRLNMELVKKLKALR